MMEAIYKPRRIEDPVMRREAAMPDRQPLFYWGVMNLLLLMTQLFFDPLLPYKGQLPKFFYFSIAGWVATALITRRTTLRIPAPIVFILLLQVWFTITTLYNEVSIAQGSIFVATHYSLVALVLGFVQASCLVYFAPEARTLIVKIIIVMTLLSALMSFFQFLGIGPAIQYGNIMRGGDLESQFRPDSATIRASGMFTHVGQPVAYSLIVLVMISSVLTHRRFKWYELAICMLMFIVPILVQVRNSIILLVPLGLWVAYLLAKRYRERSFFIIAAAVIFVTSLFFFGRDRLGYIFDAFTGQRNTFDYRRDELWPQAIRIYKERPWTGIGIEPAFAGFELLRGQTKYVSSNLMDGGWMTALAYGGIPGLTLLALGAFSGILASIRNARSKLEDNWHKACAYAAVLIVFHAITNMFFGNFWTNAANATYFFVLAGLAMPSKFGLQKRLIDRPNFGLPQLTARR